MFESFLAERGIDLDADDTSDEELMDQVIGLKNQPMGYDEFTNLCTKTFYSIRMEAD